MTKKICKAIAETCPFSLKQVEDIFKITKSFDKTITIIRIAERFAVNPIDVIN